MLEPSPAFADAALQQVSLHCPFEEFLGYGNQNTVYTAVCTVKALITDGWHAAMLTFGKKLRDGRLAAQSFFLRKSIRTLAVHDYLDR